MSAKDIINLNGQDFPLGSSGLVRINAGKLPSGNRISIFTYIFRSKILDRLFYLQAECTEMK